MERNGFDRERLQDWADEHDQGHLIDEHGDSDLDDLIEMLEELEENVLRNADRDWQLEGQMLRRVC